MQNNVDQHLVDILTAAKTIAIVGASDNPDRASFRVMQFLMEHGYDVYPVNPKLSGKTLLGKNVYHQLKDVPVTIDIVDVFRQSQYLYAIVEESSKLKAKLLWTQLGVQDVAAELLAQQLGLSMIIDRCPAIEIPRLQNLGLLKEC